MSEPIPLTDPAGMVRAYLCGCCGELPVIGQVGGARDPAEQAACALRRAAECCICHQCDGPNPRWATGGTFSECAACTAPKIAAERARRAAFEAVTDPCPACGGAWILEGCDTCEDNGRVPKATVPVPPDVCPAPTEGL